MYACLLGISMPWNLKHRTPVSRQNFTSRNKNLLCVMEVGGVIRILALSWLHLSVEATELLFSKFKRVGRSKAVYLGWNNSFHVLAIDC